MNSQPNIMHYAIRKFCGNAFRKKFRELVVKEQRKILPKYLAHAIRRLAERQDSGSFTIYLEYTPREKPNQ